MQAVINTASTTTAAPGQGLNILVVDDDDAIRELICNYLGGFAMQATGVADGREMEAQLGSQHFDAIVLDLMLPGENGLSLCKRLRMQSEIPIVMISARNDLTERIISLEIGADDFLAKPFDIRELVARLHSVLRRNRSQAKAQRSQSGHQRVRFGNWLLNSTLRQLHDSDGTIIPLSSAEFRLLSVLVQRPHAVLDRELLLDLTRGGAVDVFDRSIDILISRLRGKLRDDPRNPALIRTVRGEGYMLDAHVSPA